MEDRLKYCHAHSEGVMKRAVKWTSKGVNSVDRLEKCSLVNIDQEKCIDVDIDSDSQRQPNKKNVFLYSEKKNFIFQNFDFLRYFWHKKLLCRL